MGCSAPADDQPAAGSGGSSKVRGLCHFGERKVEELTFDEVYASEAFRPRPDTYVSIEQLRLEAQLCDVKAQPQRCEMLAAVFDGGSVTEAVFPPTMVTFF